MMNYFLYVLVGLVAGILGGMGMGGGTLLIPLLTIVLGFSQKLAQLINLISFSFMALFVVFYYIKNGLVDGRVLIIFLFSTTIAAVAGSMIANNLDAGILKRMFGVLLIVVSVCLGILEIVHSARRE